MYQYKSEVLIVGTKWFSDKANENDLKVLDDRLNEMSEQGWELVTYDYMATSLQLKGGFVVTYRKKVD